MTGYVFHLHDFPRVFTSGYPAGCKTRNASRYGPNNKNGISGNSGDGIETKKSYEFSGGVWIRTEIYIIYTFGFSPFNFVSQLCE